MNVLNLIASENYIAVNKDLIKILNLEGAVVFGELASEYIYWNNKKMLDDGYFYSTVENMQEKTSLSPYQQRQAIKKLQEYNLVDVKTKGMPAKRYIKINEEQVIKILNNKMLKNLTTRCEKIKQLDVKKFNINNNINNNINKKRNIYTAKYFDSKEINGLFIEFLEQRKKLKAVNSDRAITMLINKLNQYNDNTKKQMLEEAILKSWKSVYAPKKEKESFSEILDKW